MQRRESNPITLNKYLYGNGNPVMMTDPSGEMSFTIGDVTINISIRGILDNIAIPKLTGFLTTAVQTVWGIPKDGTAFKNPVAKLDGVSPSVGIKGIGFGIGVERLIPTNGVSENWYYWYPGFSVGFGPSIGSPVTLGLYTGNVYDNRKNRREKITIESYEGTFYTISTSAIIMMFGRNDSLPLGAMVFSSGTGGGLYGYAETLGFGSIDISVTGAWSYYYKVGTGSTFLNALINNNYDNPFISSDAWSKAISKRLGEN